MGLGTAPAALVGYLGATVRADLGLSAQTLGLVASTFYGATGIALVGSGALCDRLGARRCTLVAVAAEAAALGLVAGARSYPALEVGAALCGIGYALTNVGTTVAVADVAAPDRVGLLLAVKTVVSHPTVVWSGLLEAAFALLGAVIFFLGARGIARLRPAARTPLVVIELLCLPVGYSLGIQAHVVEPILRYLLDRLFPYLIGCAVIFSLVILLTLTMIFLIAYDMRIRKLIR